MGSLKGNPDFIVYEFWIDSQLSVARFYGGCQYNGEYYVIDLETGDLVRAEYHATYVKKHKPKRLEESAYAKARARGEV